MLKIISDDLPFSTEELAYFEIQMKKYKVPFLYKIIFGSLYKYASKIIPVLIILISVLALIGFKHPEYNLWLPMQIISFVLIFGIGGLTLISFLWHKLKVLKECKKLGLNLKQWNLLATMFNITYI